MKKPKSAKSRPNSSKSKPKQVDLIAPPTRAAAVRKKAKTEAIPPMGKSPQAASEGLIRDRVREMRRVRAGDLIPNPRNWRTHNEDQRNALRGVLAEIGFAGAILARETAEGGLMTIDGHLRSELTPDQMVPVLILDVTEAEADKLLATYDPISAMAGADAEKLDELLRGVETGSEALQEMLAKLADDAGLYQTPEPQQDDVPEPPKVPVTKPGDIWLLGAFYECDTCGKQYSYADGLAMKERCPCG